MYLNGSSWGKTTDQEVVLTFCYINLLKLSPTGVTGAVHVPVSISGRKQDCVPEMNSKLMTLKCGLQPAETLQLGLYFCLDRAGFHTFAVVCSWILLVLSSHSRSECVFFFCQHYLKNVRYLMVSSIM